MDHALCPLAPDPDAFARVWRRVMPHDRPDCPFTLSPPAHEASLSPADPEPVCCLSQASTVDLPRLELLLLSARNAARTYQALARRTGSRLMTRLWEEKRTQAARLSAARYLITGHDLPPDPGPVPRPVPMPLALRERFHAEQRLASVLLTAAQQAADPCLAALYRQQAEADRQAALSLWDALTDLRR